MCQTFHFKLFYCKESTTGLSPLPNISAKFSIRINVIYEFETFFRTSGSECEEIASTEIQRKKISNFLPLYSVTTF